jgi:ketosteroid isomerase-like protein
MPQDKLDVVRSIYDDWERGDFSSSNWMHPEIEFVGGDGTVVKGARDVGRYWFEFLAAWEGFAVSVAEMHDAPGAQVLVFVSFKGRGRESGAPVDGFPGANLFTVRDGKVTRLALFVGRNEALAAAGLSDRA